MPVFMSKLSQRLKVKLPCLRATAIVQEEIKAGKNNTFRPFNAFHINYSSSFEHKLS